MVIIYIISKIQVNMVQIEISYFIQTWKLKFKFFEFLPWSAYLNRIFLLLFMDSLLVFHWGFWFLAVCCTGWLKLAFLLSWYLSNFWWWRNIVVSLWHWIGIIGVGVGIGGVIGGSALFIVHLVGVCWWYNGYTSRYWTGYVGELVVKGLQVIVCGIGWWIKNNLSTPQRR